jgi:hypothetical protein
VAAGAGAAGAEAAGAGAAGAIGTGAVVRTGFGAGCFLAAATAGGVGRGDGDGVLAVGALGRGGVGGVPGSAVMMLTGGVEAALGNSALVGLPIGIPGIRAVTGATAGAARVFQVAE